MEIEPGKVYGASTMTRPKQIISGGQEGADLGGSEAAIILGIEPGGWVPKGGRNENGRMSEAQMSRYKFKEHVSSSYNGRTASNVIDSDGTAIFGDVMSPGSRLTVKLCQQLNKPYIVNPTAELLHDWVKLNNIEVMNTAGNRESGNPGIFVRTRDLVVEAFSGKYDQPSPQVG